MRVVALTSTAFVIFGPPIGVLFSFLPVLISGLAGHAAVGVLQQDLEVLLWVIVVAYPMAGPAALISGAVIGFMASRYRRENTPGLLARALVGAVVGGTVGGAWQWISADLSNPFLFFECGSFAGGILAVAFPRPAWCAHAL